MRSPFVSLIWATSLLAPLPALAQELPEYLLHFHGNTHEGAPLPCTGNGSVDVGVCGGPFLTESDQLDAAPAARFEFNALIDTNARSEVDSNWTWKPAAATTVQGGAVLRFWASCNATCVTLAPEWAVSVWKNNVQVAPAPTADPDDTDPTFIITAAPAAPDVPERLTGYIVIDTPIVLNGTTDTLTLKLEHNYLDAGQGSRIYYDSTAACPGAVPGEACDTTAIFNARDNDADGVPDAVDECLGTPAGVAVEPNGCPPAGACANQGAANAIAAVPAAGPTSVDLPVQVDWARLAPTAPYGAIVHFYRQGTRAQQDAVLRRAGLQKIHDFRRYTTAVYVEGTVSAFQRLVASPWIMRVEHNAPMRLLDATQSWTTRIRMVQERIAEGPYKDANGDILAGKGVTLGIIDGGLFGAHPDFTGRISHNFKIVNPFIAGVGAPQYVDVGTGDSENVAGGHGTHVTGIVAGDGRQSDGNYPNADVAPWAPGTFTSASPQANIIHWAHGAGIVIIGPNVAYQHILDNLGLESFAALRAVNNSYGETTPGTAYNPNDAGKQLIKQIVGCGINMVFAAGNDGGDGSADMTSSYCKDPTPGVICVASYNDMGTGALDAPLSSFSSRGHAGTPSEYPDIAAPGDLSTSACAQATPTQAICTGGDDNAAETEWQPWYGTISGTSMATPNIVGVIGAIAQAKPSITPAEIESLLQRTARRIGGGYEADPQLEGSTIHFGYGAGLVDMQTALNELAADPANGIVKSPLLPTDEVWSVFEGDAEPDVTEEAANAVSLTMQNFNLDGPGVMYRLTVGDATDFVSPALAYRLEQNVRGVPTRTTILATEEAVSIAEPGPNNTAIATVVAREGNVISFFVPYSQMAYPPINEPIHNVRVVVSNDAGALDYAPSPAAGTVQTAAVQPMFGRAFTTRLAPGAIPPSTERACELPGLTRVISGAGTTGDGSQTGMDDLRRIWLAEPGDMPGKLVITMKVDNLNPAPIANYRWYVYFNTPARTDVEAQFVAMDTVAPGGSSAAPGFKRGFRQTIDNPAAPVGSFTIEGDLPDSSFNTNGTITLVLDKTQFNLNTGDAITSLAGSIRQTSNPTNGAGLTVDSASALEPYVLVGNLPCPVTIPPVAALAADVTSGPPSLTVTFDASASTADEGAIASYFFDFGDGSELVEQAEPTVQHTYDAGGNYTASVVVRDEDGVVSSNAAEVEITVHAPPIANAGADGSVAEGVLHALNGTASSDPNGDALSFAWVRVSGPEVSLTGANTATPSFTAPQVCADDELIFRLTVTDTTGLSSVDEVSVLVTNINQTPVANAGSDFTTREQQAVLLNAAPNADPDCEVLDYTWTQIAGPTVSLQGADTAMASFTAPSVDSATDLRFRLEIEDPSGASSFDDVTVTVVDDPVIGDNAVGGLSWLTLVGLGMGGLLRRRRREGR